MEDSFRRNIVDYAYVFLDKPYVEGARGPDSFDCSGFIYYLFYNLFGIDINNDDYGEGELRLYEENDKYKKIGDIKIGDLVFFYRKSIEHNLNNRHVGIYIGDNKFIHASSDDGKIVISEFNKYWTSVLVASRDIISGILKSTI